MAVNKNFVVKNGIEVNQNLILGDATNNRVGIGTSIPNQTLHVFGGIGATTLHVGVSTFIGDVQVSGVTTLASAGGITTTGGALYVGSTLHVAGLSSVTDLVSSGIVTADYFYGDGSNLSNVDAASGGTIGVSSEGTVIGTGVTQINFASTNGTAWSVTTPSSGLATVTVTPGASIGLAIALGG